MIDPSCGNRELLAQYTYPGLPPGKPYHDLADLGDWAEKLFSPTDAATSSSSSSSSSSSAGTSPPVESFAATARRELVENVLPRVPLQDDAVFLDQQQRSTEILVRTSRARK